MQTRRIIRTDGTEVALRHPVTAAEIQRLIDAPRGLDHVNLIQFGDPLWVMFVDDHGYETESVDHGIVDLPNGLGRGRRTELRPVKARKPVNAKATEIYLQRCKPGTTHQIVGDVVIAPDMDFA